MEAAKETLTDEELFAEDWFAVLGLPSDGMLPPPTPASVEEEGAAAESVAGAGKEVGEREVVRAYRQLSLRYHPDRQQQQQRRTEEAETDQEKGERERMFLLIGKAREILEDEQNRKRIRTEMRRREERRTMEKERESRMKGRRKRLREQLQQNEAASAAATTAREGVAATTASMDERIRALRAEGRRLRELEERRRHVARTSAASKEDQVRAILQQRHGKRAEGVHMENSHTDTGAEDATHEAVEQEEEEVQEELQEDTEETAESPHDTVDPDEQEDVDGLRKRRRPSSSQRRPKPQNMSFVEFEDMVLASVRTAIALQQRAEHMVS